MRMWNKIFRIFRDELTHSSPNPDSNRSEQDGFQRFMEEYAHQMGTSLRVVQNGFRRTPHPEARLNSAGNGGCGLRMAWRFYEWLYPHSGWASRVRLNSAVRQEEHNKTAHFCRNVDADAGEIIASPTILNHKPAAPTRPKPAPIIAG